MKQDYFILVLAHSLHGRLQRVHIPHRIIYGILLLAVFGAVSLWGVCFSYARMAWKVANYNALRTETENLRNRYQRLQTTVNQTNAQLASLQMLAQEVSLAYGIKQKIEGPADISSEARLAPTVSESIEEYNFPRASKFSRLSNSFTSALPDQCAPQRMANSGPLDGRFRRKAGSLLRRGCVSHRRRYFGSQWHSGSGFRDGRVQFAGFYHGYGRLVIIESRQSVTMRLITPTSRRSQ